MTSYVRKVDIVKDSANVAGRKKIVFVDASSGTIVPAGSEEIITIQPPQGKIWRIKSIYFKVMPPSGASTGDHRLIYNFTGGTRWEGPVILSECARSIEHSNATIINGELQGTDIGAGSWFNNRVFNADYPFYATYKNSTDADQTNKRTLILIVEEEEEAT